MIAIDQILISDEVAQQEFVCNLQACKGGCCVEGDAGAPLEAGEMEILEGIFDQLKPFLSAEGLEEIRQRGKYVFQAESGFTTPAIGQGICAYGVLENGIVKCGIEKAFHAGKTSFIKPISCHLYPIRISRQDLYDALNYEPRDTLCGPACKLGRQLKVPVYRFLKEALIRKFGKGFYETLDQVAREKFREDINRPQP